MPVNGSEAARHFADYSAKAHALVGRYSALVESLDALRESARLEVRTAVAALSEAYLGTLSADAIGEAERLTGFRGFTRRDPLKAMAREEHVLKQTVARVLADERYRRREYLVGPAGELTRALEENQSLLDPWEQECARFEDEEGFLELVTIGYDTPSFAERFWEASYWKHWAAGDRICASLELADFGDDVLPAYREVEGERTRWRAQVAEATAAIDAVHELVREHDQALARIPQLPAIYLDGCQEVLAAHLRHADTQLLAQWLPDDEASRPIRMALRRFAGASAKHRYLVELKDQVASTAVSDFTTRAAKYNRKSAKYSRPKHRYNPVPDAHLDPSFEQKLPRYQERADKLQRLGRRISGFDAYDDFDLNNEPELWWIHITGKQPPSQLASTRRWYDQHPGLRPTRDQRSDTAAVSRAVGARELDELDYLS